MSSLCQLFMLCLLFAMTVNAKYLKRKPKCPKAYRDISPQHTFCLEDVGIPVRLTARDKKAALREHNAIRARVWPRAANMMRLEWDEDLAKVATKWAAQCIEDHDTIPDLPKLEGVRVGQNLAAGNFDLMGAIHNWEKEINKFRYGRASNKGVGHYTQMVNAETSLVGCGVAECPQTPEKRFQVCNYAVSQYKTALSTPFKKGTKGCDDCPNSCDNTGRLCACGGKVCLNNGQLNVDTCKCTCSKLYKGSRCEKAMTVSAKYLKRQPKCPKAYRDISPQHTFCLEDVGIPVRLTARDKKAALREHNAIRARVSPRAANMMRLEWDEDLAKVATKWAAQCIVDHDKIRDLPKLVGVKVGQNLAAGNFDLMGAIHNWEKEINKFRYGRASNKGVGHYTQMVNAETSLVGCGVAECPHTPEKRVQVCNYAVSQYKTALSTPFKKGTKGCDDCPNSCDNTGRLCACGGKVCLNNGQLNVDTCKCTCSKLYKGSRCEKVDCYPDNKNCPDFKKKYGDKVCKKFINMPDMCPHMCGKC